ncbi:hypothetical protein JAAARDRAFT_192417 [Jaapia argillacea MUCL 33604]|uniref:DUF6533 domain-containing protein n=1 Tax=Jaapia argillacea MUCL 33604 TaxID=933084 RepID=A0A067Q5Q5_9AGAM|nr:hypothetical protein JAAARDRAFT_192417 [Jaapia argillacea MUCL 33604]
MQSGDFGKQPAIQVVDQATTVWQIGHDSQMSLAIVSERQALILLCHIQLEVFASILAPPPVHVSQAIPAVWTFRSRDSLVIIRLLSCYGHERGPFGSAEIGVLEGICIDQEVELIWKQQWSVATILYILTRYIGNAIVIAILFLLLVDLHTTPIHVLPVISISPFAAVDPMNRCVSSVMFQGWAAIIPAWIVQVILQFRVYAIYDRSRWVAILMVAFFIVQIILATFFSLYDITDFHAESNNFGLVDFCVVTNIPKFAWASWVCIMAFEAVLFLLALWKAVVRVMQSKNRWRKGLVADILLRDNLSYFLATSTAYILIAMSMFALPPIWLEIFGSYSTVISCTLGSRLILNIRAASYRHQEIDTEQIELELQDLATIRNRWSLSEIENGSIHRDDI